MIFVFLLAGTSINAQSDKQQVTQETGVVINGVKWATCNVDAPRTFADKPEDAGMFYQWNRKVAWTVTDRVSNWNRSESDTIFYEPCPEGWYRPTYDELITLNNSEKVSSEWVNVNVFILNNKKL